MKSKQIVYGDKNGCFYDGACEYVINPRVRLKIFYGTSIRLPTPISSGSVNLWLT